VATSLRIPTEIPSASSPALAVAANGSSSASASSS